MIDLIDVYGFFLIVFLYDFNIMSYDLFYFCGYFIIMKINWLIGFVFYVENIKLILLVYNVLIFFLIFFKIMISEFFFIFII